jgi:hypothetical protein
VSLARGAWHNRRLREPRYQRDAWAAHGETDRYLPMAQVRDVCACVLPGAEVRRLLFWRYFLVWRKP